MSRALPYLTAFLTGAGAVVALTTFLMLDQLVLTVSVWAWLAVVVVGCAAILACAAMERFWR